MKTSLFTKLGRPIYETKKPTNNISGTIVETVAITSEPAAPRQIPITALDVFANDLREQLKNLSDNDITIRHNE